MALGNSCHGSTTHSTPGNQQTLALLGMPNTGKSTLYNRLTGGNALIANWPGLTVELMRGPLPPGAGGESRQLVDLPGIHDLEGHSADEAVVKDFLHQTSPDLVLVVINASQIAAQLRLVLQVLALGLPMVLALNMSGEARRLGVVIDANALASGLGIPVVAISAKRNEGIGDLLDRLARPQVPPPELPCDDLESRLEMLVAQCVQQPAQLVNWRTRRLDRWLLHPFAGVLLFLAIVLLLFQSLYALAKPLQDLLGFGLDWLRRLCWNQV